MDEIKDFFDDVRKINLISSIIIIILTFIIYRIVIYFFNKSEKTMFTSKKSKTYFKLVKNIIRYVFLAIAVLIVLQINGIDVSSLLAGVGIIGVVFGLAIQDWLKDIIRGSSILSDSYFAVGDIVKYKEIEGKVLVIGLKTTKIQDLKTSNIISIANRNIEEIEVVSKYIYINIPMPYEVPVQIAEETIKQICDSIKENENVENCIYKSVNELAESSIKYLIEITANPLYKLQVRRDAHRSILVCMAKNNISVPYNQIDVHQK